MPIEGYFTIPAGNPGRTYDLSSDGQRFLMIKQSGSSGQSPAPPQIVVVQNWTEELKRAAGVSIRHHRVRALALTFYRIANKTRAVNGMYLK